MLGTCDPEIWRTLYTERVRQVQDGRTTRHSYLKLVAMESEAEATTVR